MPRTYNRYSWDKKEHEWRIGDGVVQDTSGDVIFSVNFRAITCMPEVNEVLDGQVVQVSDSGIHVQSGAFKCFITMKVPTLCKLTFSVENEATVQV